MPVELRPVAAADEPFLRALYRSTREPELDLTSWSEAQKAAFANQQFDMQDRSYRQNYPGAELLVIERDGARIGRLYLHQRSEEIGVIDIALVPQARNAGIGTALMRDVMARAERDGLAVSLHVEAFNPARKLYVRLGFREVAGEGLYTRMRWKARAATGG